MRHVLLAVASGALVPPALVAALMRDPAVVECAKESDATATAYVNRAFAVRELRLRSGETMSVAEARDGCLALNQSTRISIYQHAGRAYRRVLDSVTMPGYADVRADGSVTLPTHETISTILESTYLWNGSTYAFSAPRSHIYDVPLEVRRPYEVEVRFAPGTSSTILTGSTAGEFGQDYVFRARAGQRITISLLHQTQAAPAIFLSSGERNVTIVEGRRWTGRLPRDGSYQLGVLGSHDSDPETPARYALRLAIENAVSLKR
jgi:hypothetical protein